MTSLPEDAFLPPNLKDSPERFGWMARRNRLFEQAIPEVQKMLLVLAQWQEVEHLPSDERTLVDLLNRQFFAYQDAFVSLGVVRFMTSLRWVPAGSSKMTAEASFENSLLGGVPFAWQPLRFAAQLIHEAPEKRRRQQPYLEEQLWKLLLTVAEQDIESALAFVDEHWKRESKWSGMLSVWSLGGQPDLAYRLALTTRVDRPEFAADMLVEAIQDAGWTVTKDRNAAPESLVSLLDAACDHLWSWLQEPLSAGIANDDIQDRLGALFRYGNPMRPYWSALPVCALKVIESISVDEQARVLSSGLLAWAVFYSDRGQQTAASGTALFRSCLQHRSRAASSVRQLSEAAVDATKAILVLEGGILSGRNRYVAARPEHPLMQVVADYLDESKDKMRTLQPATVLVDQMNLALGVRAETLFRRLMEQFRNEFEQRVNSFPVDAGLALKTLIQYKGYSQTDDNMYRKQVCQDLFDALVPSLDAVSADDAAVARSGIGWSSFPADIW